MKCRSCGQEISEEILAEKRRLKGKRVSEALLKARLEGRPVGRKKNEKISCAEVGKLYSSGLTMREVAKRLKISTWTVQNRIRELYLTKEEI